MGLFTINNISQKAFGREKRWMIYFLSSVSILANLIDIVLIRFDLHDPVFYINTSFVIIVTGIIILRYYRKIPIHWAALIVVYFIIINITISQLLYSDSANYASEFLRTSLYIWMTTLMAGFLLNRNHVLIVELWHIALLFIAISVGHPFIIDNQMMLFLAISIFTFCLYSIIYLLDKNYITNRLLLEAMHKDRVQLRIHERKLRREDEMKNRLFSIISHDLKSNSNLLLNFSILLQKRIQQKEYSPAEKMCDAIYQAADNNHNLLINLLEWTRAQSETIEFRPSMIDIDALLTEIKYFFEQTLATKNVDLQLNNSVKKPMLADGMMLSSILRNLVSNAIKFTPIHTVVSISVYSDNQHVIFRVCDDGLGMSQDKINQLLRDGIVSSTRGTSDEKGSGLGFSICRYFTEKHNGTINISSKEGKGTEVQVRLPLLTFAN